MSAQETIIHATFLYAVEVENRLCKGCFPFSPYRRVKKRGFFLEYLIRSKDFKTMRQATFRYDTVEETNGIKHVGRKHDDGSCY